MNPRKRNCELSGVEFEISSTEFEYLRSREYAFPERGELERLRSLLSFVPDSEYIYSSATPKVSTQGKIDYGPFPRFSFSKESALPYLEPLDEISLSRFPSYEGQNIESPDRFKELLYLLYNAYLGFQNPKNTVSFESTNYLCREMKNSTDCFSSVRLSDSCECTFCFDSNQLLYSSSSFNCTNSAFIESCSNCSHCLFCSFLNDKEYYIFNAPVSREEYEKTLAELRLDSPVRLEAAKERFASFLLSQPLPSEVIFESEQCSGQYVYKSKSISNGFLSDYIKDSSLIFGLSHASSIFSSVICGPMAKDTYHGILLGTEVSECLSSFASRGSIHYVEYSIACEESHHLLACVGLRGKEYCIFNKQYSPEAFFIKREEIISILKSEGLWGKPLSSSFSRIPYNASLAGVLLPLGKIQAQLLGYMWDEKRDEIRASFQGSLNPRLEPTRDNERICEINGTPFIIDENEKEVYQSLGIALPERSPQQRFKERLESCRLGPLRAFNCPITHQISKTWYSGVRPLLSREGFSRIK